MIIMVVRQRRLDCKIKDEWPKKARKSQKPMGTTRIKSTFVRWFSWWSGVSIGQRQEEKLISDFRQQRGQLNGQTDSPTGRDILLFLRAGGDEDDEVRT
jgi:hypothetical protein